MGKVAGITYRILVRRVNMKAVVGTKIVLGITVTAFRDSNSPREYMPQLHNL